MRVALVFPRFKYASGDPPLGIAYLAAYLHARSEGVSVECIDPTFEADPVEFCRSRLASGRYDIVGFSLMTPMLADALKVAAVARELQPSALILFGGPHPTVLPEETLAHECVDAVCIGEGEAVLSDLVAAGGNPAGIAGLYYKQNGQVIRNPHRRPLDDLDSLPLPARDLLPMEHYLRTWFQMESVDPRLRGTAVVATRGCPYRCTFCQPTLDKLFGSRMRLRSPANIVQELQELKERYHCSGFQFVDDNLTVNLEWDRELSEAMIRAQLGMVWSCTMRANYVDRPGVDETLALMYRAGLRKVFIGFESASERVLTEIYHKGTNLDQMSRVVALVKRHGIKIQGFFILAAPGETEAEIRATIRWARESELDEATFSICTPFPGTYLHRAVGHQLANAVSDLDYYRVYPFRPEQYGMSQRTVTRWRWRAFTNFYLAPRRLRSTLRLLTDPYKTILKLKRLL